VEQAPSFYAGILESWIDLPVTRASLSEARDAFEQLSAALLRDPGLRVHYAPQLLNVFSVTGKLRDYRALSSYVRESKSPELLEEVDEIIRYELPDIWILNALRRDDPNGAIQCWTQNQEHPRIRHAANALMKAFPDRVDILVSAHLRLAEYQISRATRSRYRRACRLLDALRSSLHDTNHSSLWAMALDQLLQKYQHRPALMDEFRKAGIH